MHEQPEQLKQWDSDSSRLIPSCLKAELHYGQLAGLMKAKLEETELVGRIETDAGTLLSLRNHEDDGGNTFNEQNLPWLRRSGLVIK